MVISQTRDFLVQASLLGIIHKGIHAGAIGNAGVGAALGRLGSSFGGHVV